MKRCPEERYFVVQDEHGNYVNRHTRPDYSDRTANLGFARLFGSPEEAEQAAARVNGGRVVELDKLPGT